MIAAAVLLYYITNRRSSPVPIEQRIAEAFRAGVDMVQIREKDLEAGALCVLACSVARDGRGGRLLINARTDVALAAGADGVHLPAGGPQPNRIRAFAPDDFTIGVSCHSAAEVSQAEQEGADFAVFGPVFETPSKRRYGPPLGLDRLAGACRSAAIPVLALGGVALENARLCLDSGAAGLAAISLFQGPEPLAPLVARLRGLEGAR